MLGGGVNVFVRVLWRGLLGNRRDVAGCDGKGAIWG